MIKHVMQACLAAAVALAIAPSASAAEKVNTTMCAPITKGEGVKRVAKRFCHLARYRHDIAGVFRCGGSDRSFAFGGRR